jgi:hypothetical protein
MKPMRAGCITKKFGDNCSVVVKQKAEPSSFSELCWNMPPPPPPPPPHTKERERERVEEEEEEKEEEKQVHSVEI